MKTSLLNPAAAPNGSEEIPVIQTVAGVKELVRMPAADLAAAGTRPTPAELQAAVLDTLIDGEGISFAVDEVAGTVTIAVDSAVLATKTELTDGLATKQAASALLASIASLTLAGNAGKVIEVNGTGDGFVLADDDVGAGGGALVDGTYGDVVISGGGTIFTVVIATDEAYGVGWNADMGPATKNALYAKIEAMVSATAGKVATASVGVANGVASLDATGKVPAGQLPSYVDDVLEYANTSAFPATGETGKIYVALDTGRQSRWSGSAYVELTASPGTTDAVPEGATNKYYTDIRVRACVMTGLIDTVGTPAATDSLLTILGKLKRQAFSQVLPLAGGSMTGNLTLLGTVIVGRDAGDTVEYGRVTFGVNGAYLRGSKINFQNVAGTQLATVQANGDVEATAALIGTGVVIRGGGAAAEGGQIVIGYGNNLAATIGGQANNTWNVDVDAASAFRIFRQNAAGAVITPIKITEATGVADFSATPTVGGAAVALQSAVDAKAPAFSAVNSYSVNTTVTDAAHNNNYNKLTGGTTRTLTFNATPTAGHTSVWVNRGTVNMTIACAAGYYKNGASATATANLTLAPGGKLTAFHEGAGVWTFDGTGF